jgi:predicted metal-dependent phosphotriesterase family hydrolase
MQARVHDNYGIFIWPDFISQKDINELAMNGYDESDIMKLLRKNTYRGLAAEMKINTWKRI